MSLYKANQSALPRNVPEICNDFLDNKIVRRSQNTIPILDKSG